MKLVHLKRHQKDVKKQCPQLSTRNVQCCVPVLHNKRLPTSTSHMLHDRRRSLRWQHKRRTQRFYLSWGVWALHRVKFAVATQSAIIFSRPVVHSDVNYIATKHAHVKSEHMQSTNIVDEDHWKIYCVTAGKSISILRWCVIFFRITFEADYTSICQAQDFARHPPFGMTCGRHAVASYKNNFLCLYFFYIVNTIGKSLNLYMYDSNDHCYTSYLKFSMIF